MLLILLITTTLFLTFDRHGGAVVPLVGGVRAGRVAFILPLIIRSQPLDHQPDFVARVPLDPHLPALHPGLERGVREALVPGGHHSHLPPFGVVSDEEPLKVLRARAVVSGDGTGQGEGEPRHAVQRARGKEHVATQNALEPWGREMATGKVQDC